jgi:hypothetical protein
MAILGPSERHFGRVGSVETVDGSRLADQDDRANVILSSMTAVGPIGT